MFGVPDRYRFCCGKGMVSDDTEHACMVAQSLVAANDDYDRFTRELASRLRGWLLLIPAGVGLATARACLKLWLGFSPEHSGVFSAGNGPAMRAAIIGAAIDDAQAIKQFVRRSTRITHTDPKAEHAALAVALAARASRRGNTAEEFIDELTQQLAGEGVELLDLVCRAIASAASGETTTTFAISLGLDRGITGYAYHTVPVALQSWCLHRGNFTAALEAVIVCGGDADSTAAIVGGIAGASLRDDEVPSLLVARLFEWPRTVAWLRRLAAQLARVRTTHRPERPLRLPIAGVLLRNTVFLVVVLAHGFRRLLPPY
jgi:ADP-ribosylglycohydrolase